MDKIPQLQEVIEDPLDKIRREREKIQEQVIIRKILDEDYEPTINN